MMVGFKKYEQFLTRKREYSSEQFPTTSDLSTGSKDLTVIKEENGIGKDESDNKKKEIYNISNNSMESPKLFLEIRGERSLVTVSKSRRVPLTFSCVQSLILQSMLGKKAPLPPVWCNLLREKFMTQVNIIIADGFGVSELTAIFDSQEDYGSDDQIQESPLKKLKSNLEEEEDVVSKEREDDLSVIINRCLPRTSDFFPLKLEIESPTQHCNQPARELFDNIPMSANVVQNVVKGCKSLFEASKKNIVDKFNLKDEEVTIVAKKYEPSEKTHEDKMNRMDLLLSVQEMATHGYPLKVEGTESHKDPEFVPLHENYDEVTEKSPMYGIDCEMCLTTAKKNELTRVSVVDEKFNVIYSSFVKPRNHIVNYLTKFSGVTVDHLVGVETSVQNVQRTLRKILPKDCILVGHSLEHDLSALKLLHPYVIDTSQIYNLTGNQFQSSLKMLTKLLLKKDIQTYTTKGHDPAEDAAAALDLALLKLRNDVSFGDVRMGGAVPATEHEKDEARRSTTIEKHLNFYSNRSMTDEYQSSVFKIIKLENCFSRIFTTGKRSGCVFNNLGCDNIIRCENINEVFKKAKSKAKIVVRYCRISDKKLKKKATKLELLDKNIKKLHDSLPKKSLLLVLFTAGSHPSVPVGNRSKGVLLIDLIGQERRQFNKLTI